MKMLKSILSATVCVVLLLGVSSCKESVEKVELEKTVQLFSGSEAALQMSCSLDWPLGGYDRNVVRTIQRNIVEAIFPNSDSFNNPEQAFLQWVNETETDYKECNLADSQEHGESPYMNWERSVNGKLYQPYNGVVSYVYDHYTYLGGAHGGTYRGTINMDVNTGRIITAEDIFEAEYHQRLTSLLQEYLPKYADMNMIENPSISPSSDFYVTSEGITYIYQQYEIGPYVLGIVEVLIPWSELTFIK